MKPICLLFVLPLLGTGCRTEQSAYLEKALSQLERIERVAYRRSSESYLPGDTIPRRYLRYYVEQRNRADTTLRHSYLSILQRRRTRHASTEDTTERSPSISTTTGAKWSSTTSRFPERPTA